ncbi:MAG: ribonuclease P protein component [Gammaproteobacteria bacterium]|nr:ribonuclease P protein component [Gammaproteobacteria bacterium]
MSEALKKTSRLLEKADYEHVFKKGLRHHGKYFLVIVCPNELETARVGVVVSRKVSPRAVVRNQIKRQIRESFRRKKNLLKGLDFVVVAKNAAAGIDRLTLRSSLESYWRKNSDNVY